MYNKIILAGNLTRDIEIKYTQSGSAIGNTAIATSRKFKAANGEQKEETLFIDLTFFGRTAEIANQYLRKGSKVLVDGRLKLDQWTAEDGTKRSRHSVTVENLQMIHTERTDGQAQPMDQQAPQQQQAPQGQQPQYQQAQTPAAAAPGTYQNQGQPGNPNPGHPAPAPNYPQQQGQPGQQPRIPQFDEDGNEIPF